jgi:uncharacterized protein YbaA (DUF1428 family)
MYVQGYVIPVPEDKKEAYLALAELVNPMFVEFGAIEIVETWEDHVDDGKHTDFRQAVKAQPGEKIVFSWTIWPDKATFEEAHRKMQEDERMKEPPADMPFDGKRMIFGEFAPIYTFGR